MLHPEKVIQVISLALLGSAVVAASTLASASSTEAVQESKAVRYGDLDLSKPRDAARLYARITLAAREVCRDYKWSSVQLDCYEAAVNEAVAKVHQPLLSALLGRHAPAARGTRVRA
jgi:UrcA family protein